MGAAARTKRVRNRAAAPNSYVAYTRVSTEEQADSGAGMGAQRYTIESEAARRGWTIVEWRSDPGLSAATIDKRPGLLAALQDVQTRRASGIVVAKLDRLSRSLLDFATLMKQAQAEGWNIVALDLGIDLSTPGGEFMGSIMASAAQWERRIIGQRTRDALAIKRAEGVRLGRPRVLSDETILRIVDARLWESKSFGEIADMLNGDSVPTARGGTHWHKAVVRKVLLSQDGSRLTAEAWAAHNANDAERGQGIGTAPTF